MSSFISRLVGGVTELLFCLIAAMPDSTTYTAGFVADSSQLEFHITDHYLWNMLGRVTIWDAFLVFWRAAVTHQQMVNLSERKMKEWYLSFPCVVSALYIYIFLFCSESQAQKSASFNLSSWVTILLFISTYTHTPDNSVVPCILQKAVSEDKSKRLCRQH